MSVLSTTVGGLPYPVLMHGYDLTLANLVSWRARISAARESMPSLSKLDLASVKKSNVVSILGSGASINAISSARWKAIAEGDTFGFNFWIRHPHVPTLYTVECLERRVRAREMMTLARLAYEREQPYMSVPKIITDVRTVGLDMVRLFPASWKSSLFAAETRPVFARSEPELRRAIGFLLSQGEFGRARTIRRLFKYRATLSMLVTLAVRMGYRSIVLCGIDLNTPGYFYQDTKLYPDMAGFSSSPAQPVHTTLLARPLMRPIDEVIMLLDELVVRPAGARLYIESRDSALFPRLDLPPRDVLKDA